MEPLEYTAKYFPNLNPTTVKVVRGDTFDTAVTLENARELMGCQDTQKICVLNFANAKDIGGGWLKGAMAQEEELCYRSTLSATLKDCFYPLGELAAVYSANVVIFRENYAKNHSLMWHESPELLPVVSVISMAATDGPAITVADDGQEKYLNTLDRDVMKDKMRLILRVAGHSGHRTLVLGAFGCGVFRNPKHDVAHCWAEVLKESEFKGWWEVIVFAILEKKAESVDGADLTLQIFRSILGNLQV
ncbi:hypothetical protein N7474_006777 [Penicillium riverlandense]|uniref:uncharacterized protein n=1 Tax=Penicillium riverlandense TaxID=1903569 RepID=UPI002548C28F|nr:uncharacterized protein N7474_006777 [Penicillium riverlandense]KAJ5815000.1 hypothetical protein N7474_006777 [Penicillium riverlandense]